jgi:VWFA-related protein
MRSASSLSLVLAVVLATAAAFAQQLPRFRSGANLVRVDAYVTADGVPVKDLQLEDFEVLEDGVAQRVESFQLVQPRGPAPVTALREPNTVGESRQMARDPESRVFVIFMDLWHVQIEGSFHARAPVSTLLTRVIGEDDLVGVMTPDMAARTLTLARRPETIEGIFKDYWYWGQRGRLNTLDPAEQELRQCYPADRNTEELIRRRREHKTLTALEDLIVHLESVREERKFVLLLTEGWRLGGPLPGLSTNSPAPPGIGVDPGGRLRLEPRRGMGSVEGSCDRERAMLGFIDMNRMFDDLIQRANRANVSFYPMDPRGLVVFDSPIGPEAPPPPSVDAANLRQRHDSLRTLAVNSDGYALLDTNALGKAVERMAQDTGAYYLLGYYSTNSKLDGKYRRLTVRVKRKGLDVRARPGYLAPTQADMTASNAAAAPEAPARVMSSLRGTALRRGPSTGLAYVQSKESSYRRTERLRYEVPLAADVPVAARLLGPTGTPVNVPVVTSTRTDAATEQRLLVVDLTLAPLAQGEYELELTLQQQSGPEVVAYRFGLVP